MATDRLEAATRNGKRAAILLDDPLLNEALDKLLEQAVQKMMTCNADDLLEARAEAAAIERFRRCLRAYVDNGLIAEVTLKSN